MPISKAGSGRVECGEEKTISILGGRELTSVVESGSIRGRQKASGSWDGGDGSAR